MGPEGRRQDDRPFGVGPVLRPAAPVHVPRLCRRAAAREHSQSSNGPPLDDPFAAVAGGNPFPLVRNANMTFPQSAKLAHVPARHEAVVFGPVEHQLPTAARFVMGRLGELRQSRGHRLPIGDNINPAVFETGATMANANQRRTLYLEDPQRAVLRQDHSHRADWHFEIRRVASLAESPCVDGAHPYRQLDGLDVHDCWSTMSPRWRAAPPARGPRLRSRELRRRRSAARPQRLGGLPVSGLSKGVIGMLTKDWQFLGIARAQSGDHFEVTTGFDNALNGQANQRPNQVAHVDPYMKDGISG